MSTMTDAYETTIEDLAFVQGSCTESEHAIVSLAMLRPFQRDEEGESAGSFGLLPDEARALATALIEAALVAEQCAGDR